MNSAEAREYVRLATTETKGRTKMACDLLIAESIKLEKIEHIVEEWNNNASHSFSNMCQIKGMLGKE